MIGRLEMIFGPQGDEAIEKAINGTTQLEELPGFKEKILALLDEDKREQAGKIFDQIVPIIYKKYERALEIKSAAQK
jgi:hypothetical protein